MNTDALRDTSDAPGDGPPPPPSAKSGAALAVPFLAVGALVLAADQAAKHAVVTLVEWGGSVAVTPFLSVVHVTNTGSAFGLLQGQSGFLMLASAIGVLAVIFYYRANGRESLLLRVALGLVLGGALGNLSDRVFRGAVVDFIEVELWPGFHWPAFNVADSSLLVGLTLLAFYVMRQRDRRRPEDTAAQARVDGDAGPPHPNPLPQGGEGRRTSSP